MSSAIALGAVRCAKTKLGTKFVNSSQQNGETRLKNRIYQKGSRLFGFHLAKKAKQDGLYIFEGYADCATAQNAGLLNCCAIGAAAFTGEHLNVILEMGLAHVIFVLDGDAAGAAGTERFVELVETQLGGHIGLRVEIVVMPEEFDDPDAMIRKHGLDAFLNLEKVDVFTWKLQQLVVAGGDPDQIVERHLPLIMNEVNGLKRSRQAEQLAAVTGVSKDVIWAEVLRRCDLEKQQVKEELSLLADRTAKLLAHTPGRVKEILFDSTRQMERISTLHQGYDLKGTIGYIDGVMEEADAHVSSSELNLGWPMFDRCFGGIPRSDAFITIPGKPNQGKSSLLANLAGRLVDHNDEVIVIYHTVDDAMRWFLPRLFGSRYRVPSEYFYKSGYHLAQNSLVRVNGAPEKVPFRDVYAEAKLWLKTKLLAERLLPYDAAMLDQSIFSLEMRVREVRKQNPRNPIVVFGDNFHLYSSPAIKEEGEAKTRGMSMACKNLANVHHVTLIMTMELPKAALGEGMRPRIMNIKGSAGISYDSSANIGVYNDQKDRRERADLIWEDDMEPTEIEPGQVVTRVRRPVLELVFDKSKVNVGFDGNIYYQFHPPSGQVIECAAADQEIYRKRALRYLNERHNQRPDEHKGAQFVYETVAEELAAEPGRP